MSQKVVNEKVTNIARNTSYFTLALILQKVISLTYFTLYARALGPNDLGQYYFAISITSIFSIFIDFGLGNIITREIAKDTGHAKSFISNILSVKLIFSGITLGLLWIWMAAFNYPALTRDLICISAFTMVFDNFTSVFFSALRGKHNLKYESISSVIVQSIVLVLSLVILGLGWDIRWLMVSLAAGSLYNLIYSAFIAWRLFALPFVFSWNRELVKKILLLSLPFAIYAIFQRFYTYFDSVLLFKFAGDGAVGLYQVPFKIIVALQFLPMAFTASLYPALSAYWHRNREQLSITFERAINYSLILSVPIMIGTIVLARQVVVIFKEGFADAVLPLQLVMLSLPFMFLGFPVGALLNACDRQKRNTWNIAITSIVSAALNFYLIPRMGVLGACLTNLLTSILMLVLGWVVVGKITVIRPQVFVLMFARVIGAGLAMGAMVYFLREYLATPLTIVAGALAYIICLYLFRGFSSEDLKSVWQSLRPRNSDL